MPLHITSSKYIPRSTASTEETGHPWHQASGKGYHKRTEYKEQNNLICKNSFSLECEKNRSKN